MLRSILGLLLCFTVGCSHIQPSITRYSFTTHRPTATVQEAIANADPLVDETSVIDLPYAEPTQLQLGQPAPFPGVLFSEYDTARYRLLDEHGEAWRLRAITAEWQVARTEYRDAELVEALNERVQFVERQSTRRSKMLWLVFGAGAVLGIGSTLGIRGLLR
jgi:hypothetical protein